MKALFFETFKDRMSVFFNINFRPLYRMRNYLRIAIFCSFIGLITGLTYNVLRLGLDENSYWGTYKVVGFLWFLLFTPLFINDWASNKGKTNPSFYPSVSILILIGILGVISFLNLNSFFSWLLSIVGGIQFLFYFFCFLRGSSWIEYVVGLPFTLIASFTTAAHIYHGLAKPHLFEALVATHMPNNWPTDTLWHTCFVQMINSYGVVSTGLDGIPFINYHFGSHFIFQPLSNLLQIDPLTFYTLACPVIFSSIFFFVFFHAIIQIHGFINKDGSIKVNLGFLFWIFFFIIFFGPLKRGFIWLNKLQFIIPGIAANSGIMISESYLISMILSFVVLTIILLKVKHNKKQKSDNLFYLLILPAFLFIITITKVSTGFILFSVLIYLSLRFGFYKKRIANLGILLGIIVWLLAYWLSTDPNSEDGTISFDFFKNDVAFIVSLIAFHYFATYILVGIELVRYSDHSISAFKSEKISNILVQVSPSTNLISSIKQKKTILAEVALVMSIVGFAPRALLSIHVNGGYFTEIQFYFSMAALLAYIASIDTSALSRNMKPIIKNAIIAVVFFAFSYIPFYNMRHFMMAMIDANLLFRKTMLMDFSFVVPREEIMGYLRKGELFSADTALARYGKPVQKRLDGKKEYTFLKKLRELNKLPHPEKRNSMIYVDYKHSGLYFDLLCYDLVLLAPALSGLAQLNGMFEDEKCTYLKEYRYNKYKLKSIAERDRILTDNEICNLATEKGFKQVFVYRPESGEFVKVQCSK